MQLMKLRAEDNAQIISWLEKKTDKYTSPEMQNEILKTMAMQVLRSIVESLRSVPFLTIMVDETTDISNKEQVVICFRWVDDKLESHEEFAGMYQVESTQATVLVGIIHDGWMCQSLRLEGSVMMGQHLCQEYVEELPPRFKKKNQEQCTHTVMVILSI